MFLVSSINRDQLNRKAGKFLGPIISEVSSCLYFESGYPIWKCQSVEFANLATWNNVEVKKFFGEDHFIKLRRERILIRLMS